MILSAVRKQSTLIINSGRLLEHEDDGVSLAVMKDLQKSGIEIIFNEQVEKVLDIEDGRKKIKLSNQNFL